MKILKMLFLPVRKVNPMGQPFLSKFFKLGCRCSIALCMLNVILLETLSILSLQWWKQSIRPAVNKKKKSHVSPVRYFFPPACRSQLRFIKHYKEYFSRRGKSPLSLLRLIPSGQDFRAGKYPVAFDLETMLMVLVMLDYTRY